MCVATLSVHYTTAGSTIHIDNQLNEYHLELCNMAALFLLDQINKHHTSLSSERDSMSFLLSDHYTLEMSSCKYMNKSAIFINKIKYKL